MGQPGFLWFFGVGTVPRGTGRLTVHNTSCAAKRQRVYRARKRAGARFMRSDLSGEVVDALIAEGWVGPHEVGDPVRLGKAMADLIDCWARGTLKMRLSPARYDITPAAFDR